MTDAPSELFERAVQLHRVGHVDDAEATYRLALETNPNDIRVLTNLGSLLRHLKRFSEAELLLHKAVNLDPMKPVAIGNLGNLYRYIGRLDEAALAYEQALQLDTSNADVRHLLGDTYLAQGRYSEGWPLYEARAPRRTSGAHRLTFPEWRGEPLAGRSLFIWQEQGLGDQIQNARFVRILKSLGATHISWATPPALVRLFQAIPDLDYVIPCGPGDEFTVQTHDYWTLPFSIPRYLQIEVENIPSDPYLFLPNGVERPQLRRTKRGKFQVGYIWKGSPGHVNDANRSFPSPEPLARLANEVIDLIDLQVPRGDLADLAIDIGAMDLLISVDTSAAHLAGALGMPCWVLLPNLGTDWRWMQNRTDSPWYPSMTLYRQREIGNWSSTLSDVRRDLTLKFRLDC